MKKKSFLIEVLIPEEEKSFCKVCNTRLKSPKSLAPHLSAGHKIKFVDYLIKYYLNNEVPSCKTCGEPTKFVRGKYGFRQYCPEHVKDAQREWSKKNMETTGFNPGWRKGLTKEDHAGIKSQSEKMKGELNPFFGKKHDTETYEIISAKRSEAIKLTEKQFSERISLIEKNTTLLFLGSYKDNFITANDKNLLFCCSKCGHEVTNSLTQVSYYKRKCPCCDQKHAQSTKDLIASHYRLSREEFEKYLDPKTIKFEVLTSYSEYKNLKQKLKLKCLTCGDITKRTTTQLREGTACWHCNPSSLPEADMKEFLYQFNESMVENSRKIIPPKEIDIYFPSKYFAIEFNGLFWHSDRTKPRDYHKNKFVSCKNKQITLYQVFDDEWKSKREIVESMLSYRMGKSKHTIYARKCEIKQLKPKERKGFYTQSHIAGDVAAKVAFALIHNDKICAVLSLRQPRHKKKYPATIEIARFASLINHNIPGAFSKLLKYAKKWSVEQGYKTILTYADLRFGEGKVYSKNGFEKIGETVPDYFYTDGRERYNRFIFRAQDGKSEKEVAKEYGVHRVYGAGSYIYQLKIQ